MGPVEKALWFVENKFAREITLDQIAEASGVSRYHLSRAFSIATGHSVMGYVRARQPEAWEVLHADSILGKGIANTYLCRHQKKPVDRPRRVPSSRR